MKILINALSARRGGIVTYTRNVTAALVERGLDVVIAAPSNLNFERGHGQHIKIDVANYRPLRRGNRWFGVGLFHGFGPTYSFRRPITRFSGAPCRKSC